jgi:hypothetical protein
MINDENYIAIQGWMLKLGIKGNALIAFACIYGFSQDSETEFTGSAQYIADWCGISRNAAFDVLKGLTEKELVIKTDVIKNGVKLCNYKYNREGTKKLGMGAQETCAGGAQETCHHNISSYSKDKIDTPDMHELTLPAKKEIKTDEQFQIFYQAYPKKTNKTDAKKTFTKLLKQGITLDTILSKLKVYEKQLSDSKTELQYVRNPQRFLNTLDDFEIPAPVKNLETCSTEKHCPECGGLVEYGQCTACGIIIGLDGKEVVL